MITSVTETFKKPKKYFKNIFELLKNLPQTLNVYAQSYIKEYQLQHTPKKPSRPIIPLKPLLPKLDTATVVATKNSIVSPETQNAWNELQKIHAANPNKVPITTLSQ